MIHWAEEHPGKTSLNLLLKMKSVVGEDGEKLVKSKSAPAVAKQYDLRILKHIQSPNGMNQRNQREMSTLCVILDHLALGRHQQASDVAAARLKAVECANREGHFHNAQFLELLPVNVEGLTTADEKQLVQNEAQLNQKSWNSSGDAWWSSGKASKGESYNWIPNVKAKGKDKGKDKAKGKGKGKDKAKKGKDKDE